jgi:tRNA-dihydrouridine synthase B
MAVRLGPIQIEHPFILAPMAGITHSPFRRLMRQMKCSLVVSELVSANGLKYGGRKTLELLRFNEEERPVGLQIFGEDTELLCRAAQVVEGLKADFVDLNFGCPVPKVIKKGAGAAMCRDPLKLGRALAAIVKAVRIPVTIKIRSGWDANSKNALECVQTATDAGIAWVAIHGRTRAQGYTGQVDWEYIGEIKAKSRIPIIGNGDITTPEIAVERVRTYGVDAVMIGRGVLRNPFIFEQSVALWEGQSYEVPTAERYLMLLDQQRQLFSSIFTPQMAMINFLAWYSSGFSGCHEFRRRVFTIIEPEALWSEARDFFAKNTILRDPRYLSQPFLMGGHG